MVISIKRILPLLIFSCLFLLVSGPVEAAPAPKPGVAVLLFHQLTPGHNNFSSVMTPEEFEETIVTLKKSGYNFINLPTLHAFLEKKAPVPAKAVLITFDDGYENVYKYAHPVLVKHQVPAVMFPVMKYYALEKYNALPHLTQEQTQEMMASGLWHFGGHSYDGHHLIPISANKEGAFLANWRWSPSGRETKLEYKARVWQDISLTTRQLQELGIKSRDFAPPYGKHNPVLDRLLRMGGYKFIHVQQNRLNYPGSTYIYRVYAKSPSQTRTYLDNLFRKK